MNTTDIEVLKSKLETLREREKERGQADEQAHEMATDEDPYALRPPLDPVAAAALESEHNITLPDDFKAFLMTLGDGGAGPSYYDCFSLEQAFAESRKTIYGFDEPFEPPESTDDMVDEAAPGMLLVGYEGCSYYTGLVLTGPEAGSIWSYVEVRPGWIPLPDPSEPLLGADRKPYVWNDDYGAWYNALLLPSNRHLRMSYTRWYEQWIDNLLTPATPTGHA